MQNKIKIMKKHMQEQNRLWDYQILKQLGRGQYGQVFQVRSKKDQKIYALKKINLSNAHEKEKIQAYRQIKALKLIHHPSIIEYFQSFLSMDNIYIVTEYAQKGDLLREIQKRVKLEKKFTEDELWETIMVLVDGIKNLHQKNIVHRDIKAENIFQTSKGMFRIGDLGMSKIIYQANDMISTRVGTPIYFAPQVIQHRLYSFPVDIWALGCVFYYMAALEHPFKQATIQTLGYYMIDKDIRPIKGPYSPQLIAFITSMLDKNPQTRPNIHTLYKKLKERKQGKIHNKVSIFNLKQILYLKASRDKQISEEKIQTKKLNNKKYEDQIQSPTLLYHRKSSRVNPQSDSKQINKNSGIRKLSLILTKRNKITTTNESSSPMIKSNGFTTNLIDNPRYNKSVYSSPKKQLNGSNQIYFPKARARKSFELNL